MQFNLGELAPETYKTSHSPHSITITFAEKKTSKNISVLTSLSNRLLCYLGKCEIEIFQQL